MKDITYSTPKRIQIELKKPLRSTPGKKKYPKTYCPRLKKDHDYKWVRKSGYFSSIWHNEVCKGCGKKRDYYFPSDKYPTLEEFLKVDRKERLSTNYWYASKPQEEG